MGLALNQYKAKAVGLILLAILIIPTGCATFIMRAHSYSNFQDGNCCWEPFQGAKADVQQFSDDNALLVVGAALDFPLSLTYDLIALPVDFYMSGKAKQGWCSGENSSSRPCYRVPPTSIPKEWIKNRAENDSERVRRNKPEVQRAAPLHGQLFRTRPQPSAISICKD